MDDFSAILDDWDDFSEPVKTETREPPSGGSTYATTRYTTHNPYEKVSIHQQMAGFSVTGSSDELKQKLLDDKFVLKGVAILGQWTTIYAAPNTGKTLLTLWMLREAISQGDIDGELVYYINADDNYRGVVAKTELVEDIGMHMLVPNLNQFESSSVPTLMQELASSGEAHGSVIILDTLKKFTDLMQKQEASKFGNIARGFVSAGGTLIALAHTNKHKNSEGQSVYSGTSDIRDDSDCVFIIDKISDPLQNELVSVEFRNDKARGDVESTLGFSYQRIHGQPYAELLDTVKRIDNQTLDDTREQAAVQQRLADDKEVIDAVITAINSGTTAKSGIASAVNKATTISQTKIRAILEERTGNMHILGHRWEAEITGHNKHEYKVLVDPSSLKTK